MPVQLFRHPRARFRGRVGGCLKRPTSETETEGTPPLRNADVCERDFAKRLVDGVQRENGAGDRAGVARVPGHSRNEIIQRKGSCLRGNFYRSLPFLDKNEVGRLGDPRGIAVPFYAIWKSSRLDRVNIDIKEEGCFGNLQAFEFRSWEFLLRKEMR